jgi:hypothetical protein
VLVGSLDEPRLAGDDVVLAHGVAARVSALEDLEELGARGQLVASAARPVANADGGERGVEGGAGEPPQLVGDLQVGAALAALDAGGVASCGSDGGLDGAEQAASGAVTASYCRNHRDVGQPWSAACACSRAITSSRVTRITYHRSSSRYYDLVATAQSITDWHLCKCSIRSS